MQSAKEGEGGAGQDRLNLPQEGLLGRSLLGQREGAAQWFQELKKCLIETGLVPCPEAPTLWRGEQLILLVHADDMIIGGTDEAVSTITDHLMKRYKVSIEEGENLSFLKRTINVDASTTKIMMNEKYIHSLVKLMSPLRRSRTPGTVEVDGAEMMRGGQPTGQPWGLCSAWQVRPDIQFQVKELASKLQKPTEKAWLSLKRLVGYLAVTMDTHIVMRSQVKNNSFRNRARGLTTAPMFEEKEDTWLLEVACDSDWSGNNATRSSTSAGCIFLAGNWIHAYARTQKNITLSSAVSEYVALVSGASEGLLLKAVIERLTQEKVVLVVYGDNSSSLAIAQREGVGKLKHLSGRLLWLQQRQGEDLGLRKLDTATNPSDLGTKSLTGNSC